MDNNVKIKNLLAKLSKQSSKDHNISRQKYKKYQSSIKKHRIKRAKQYLQYL